MMREEIDERNLLDRLRTAFPELEDGYQERAACCKGEGRPGNYEMFGSVFKPRFSEELARGEVTDFLRRSGTFFEQVCRFGDAEAVNVIWVTVFEWLIYRRKDLELLWPLLGPATRAAIKDAAHRWSVAARRLGRTRDLPEENLPIG
jgi:hypothetical protein